MDEDNILDRLPCIDSKKCIKKRRRSNVVEKFREVSDIVWVYLKAVIIEKTIKEE